MYSTRTSAILGRREQTSNVRHPAPGNTLPSSTSLPGRLRPGRPPLRPSPAQTPWPPAAQVSCAENLWGKQNLPAGCWFCMATLNNLKLWDTHTPPTPAPKPQYPDSSYKRGSNVASSSKRQFRWRGSDIQGNGLSPKDSIQGSKTCKYKGRCCRWVRLPEDVKGQWNCSGGTITPKCTRLRKDRPETDSSPLGGKIRHCEAAYSFQRHFIKTTTTSTHPNEKQTKLAQIANRKAEVIFLPWALAFLISVSRALKSFSESCFPLFNNEFHICMCCLKKKKKNQTGKLINNSIHCLLPTDHILFMFQLLC